MPPPSRWALKAKELGVEPEVKVQKRGIVVAKELLKDVDIKNI